jgi:CheY-like chemotaxis protein
MRILVADDTNYVLELLELVLAKRGHTVTTATNGKELLDKLGDGKAFDMVLTDNDMPIMKGIDALVRIRNEPDTAEMPVIVLSADTGIKSKVLALNAIYVDKAVDKHDMLWSAVEQIAASIK